MKVYMTITEYFGMSLLFYAVFRWAVGSGRKMKISPRIERILFPFSAQKQFRAPVSVFGCMNALITIIIGIIYIVVKISNSECVLHYSLLGGNFCFNLVGVYVGGVIDSVIEWNERSCSWGAAKKFLQILLCTVAILLSLPLILFFGICIYDLM